MIEFDTSSLNELKISIDNLNTKGKQVVVQGIKTYGLKIEAGAKRNLTSNGSVKTGNLRRNVTTSFGNMEAKVHTSNTKYARRVEEGTRPHIIRPKNKKALYWKGANRPVKFVNHPGSRAKPFLMPAFEKEKNNFINDILKKIEW